MKRQLISIALAFAISLCSISPCYANGVLTITDAVNYTLKANTEYLNLLDSASQNEKNRDNTILDYMDRQSVNSNGSDWLTTQAQLMQYDARIALQSSNEELKRLSLQNTLTRYFMNIITAKSALELTEQNLEISAADLKILKTKLELGLISQTAYNTAEADYKKSQNDLKTRANSIDGAYIELNRLMGVDLENRYELALDVSYGWYTIMPDVNLDWIINNSIRQSTAIKQKESELEIAAFKRDQSWAFSSGTDNREELELQVVQARRALDDAKENLRVSITNSYNEIRNLETQIATNQIELKSMKDQLAVKETELKLGRITSLEVKKYRLQIAQFEETLRQQIYNQELAVWQFDNPELL